MSPYMFFLKLSKFFSNEAVFLECCEPNSVLCQSKESISENKE